MTNVVCERLGITYPILQGPMAWASDSGLVAAVSNAGGLGILGIGSVPVEVARAEVRKTNELTGLPFGFNAYAFLPTIDAMCDMIVEEEVPVVEIGTLPGLFGPLAGHVARMGASGVKVIGKAASVEEAVAYERAGVDFISIKGADGGGHIFGFTGTFSLLPQVVDAVSVPVICGGGIAGSFPRWSPPHRTTASFLEQPFCSAGRSTSRHGRADAWKSAFGWTPASGRRLAGAIWRSPTRRFRRSGPPAIGPSSPGLSPTSRQIP